MRVLAHTGYGPWAQRALRSPPAHSPYTQRASRHGRAGTEPCSILPFQTRSRTPKKSATAAIQAPEKNWRIEKRDPKTQAKPSQAVKVNHNQHPTLPAPSFP